MSTPLDWQCSAALRAVSRTNGVALCHFGSVALVSNRAENGAAFMMPMSFDFKYGTRSASIVFCSVVVVRQDHIQQARSAT